MDGVIADFNFGKACDFDKKRPLYSSINKLENISKKDNVDLYIFSATRMNKGYDEKQYWLDMFKLVSKYKPTGDQPQAIEYLSEGIKSGKQFQTLLGVTGSGKTFTMANIIQKVQKPTLVLAHNKTLAGQLYSEFKEFFPENNVEYFVSYYDYYQPEAYVPSY